MTDVLITVGKVLLTFVVGLGAVVFIVWGERKVAVEEGRLVLPEDMIRMGIINRHGAGTPMRIAFLENWAVSGCAPSIATTSGAMTLFIAGPMMERSSGCSTS